jgi:hypothetical protein
MLIADAAAAMHGSGACCGTTLQTSHAAHIHTRELMHAGVDAPCPASLLLLIVCPAALLVSHHSQLLQQHAAGLCHFAARHIYGMSIHGRRL